MSSSTVRNGILAVVLFFISIGVFGVMSYQVGVQGERLESQIEVLAAEESQEALYLRLKRVAEDSVSDRAALQTVFLNTAAGDSEKIDFLNKVEGVAKEVGIELKTERVNEIAGQTDVEGWLEASFSLSGSRERVQQFIRLLELLPYVSRIVTANISAGTGGQWSADVKMQVKLMEYEA
jgi:hypothetical protein